MSKEEIKFEIANILDRFPDKALEELLAFLKKIEVKNNDKAIQSSLHKILSEDKELLARLAQ